MTKFLMAAVLVLIGLYLAVTVSLFVFQRRLIYPTDPTHHTPAEAGLDGVQEVQLTAPDGVRLIAWELKPARGQPTLLYFHGNGGGLFGRADRFRRFAREGLGVFMPAYRGYSGSGGEPSETALIADAQLAYDHLIAKGADPRRIVAYGESLGTGVAVQLAASRQVAAVVLDAPYTALAEIGQRRYPFIPVRLFLKDTFATTDYITRIRAPLLILHGSEDRTIPVALGRELYEMASEPKELHVLEGAGHSDIYLYGAMSLLRSFLAAHLGQPAGAPR
jgi:uncharacterized protein